MNDKVLRMVVEMEGVLQFHPGGDNETTAGLVASCKDLASLLMKAGLQPKRAVTCIWLRWPCCACTLHSVKSRMCLVCKVGASVVSELGAADWYGFSKRFLSIDSCRNASLCQLRDHCSKFASDSATELVDAAGASVAMCVNGFYIDGLPSQKATEAALLQLCNARSSARCPICLKSVRHTRLVCNCACSTPSADGQFEVIAVESFKLGTVGELDGQLLKFLRDSSQVAVDPGAVKNSSSQLQQCVELDVHLTTASTCPAELLAQLASAEAHVHVGRCGTDGCSFVSVLQRRSAIYSASCPAKLLARRWSRQSLGCC